MTNKSDKILAPIKRRIVEFIENQQIEKKFFFKNLGVASSNFRGQALYSEVSADIVAKILSLYPNSNAEWFLLGKGEMLMNPEVAGPSSLPQENDNNEIVSLLKDKIVLLEKNNALLERENSYLQKELQYHKKTTQSTMPDALHQSTK